MPHSNRLTSFALLLFLWLFQYDVVAESFVGIQKLRPDRYARFTQFDFEGIREIGAVAGFVQDRNGYIWMAGEKGLGRFDGYRLKVYKGNSAAGNLPSSVINKIKLDPLGNLWVASSSGLSRYIPEKDLFETIYGKFSTNQKENSSFAVRAFLFQSDSIIWIATQLNALMRINRKDDVSEIVIEGHAIDQPYYRYHHLERINENQLIFGGRSRGPYIYDISGDSLIYLPVDKNDSSGKKREYDVSVLKRKGDNEYWIAGFEGLYQYMVDENYFTKVWKGSVYDLMQDRNGYLWLGTGNGLVKFNLQNEDALLFQKNNDDPQSIGGTRIYAVFQERSGRIWIGHDNGVSIYLEQPNGIQYLFHIPGDSKSPASSSVSALANAGSQAFWIGTTDAGLDLYDAAKVEIQHFSLENETSILAKNIRCLANDKRGNLYIGYWAGRGFGVYNYQLGVFNNYTYNSDAFLDDWYNDIAFTADNKVWLGFWGGPGLTIFDPDKKTFDIRPAQFMHDTYLARRIQRLLVDSRNRLWIGTTQSGIQRIDPGSKQAISFFSDLNPTGGFDDLQVLAITELKDETIYASSKSGLYKYHESIAGFKKVPFHEIYANLEIFAIHPNKEYLWLLTSNGLLRYNTTSNWISDYSILVDLNFSQLHAAIIELNDGRLVAGGSNGIALLQPDMMGLDHALPTIFFTQLQILGKEVIPFPIQSKRIELAWNDNFFTIHFGTDKWDKKQHYNYLHKLEGFDKDWVRLTNNNGLVQYTNVPAGIYEFKMKAIDINGELSGNEISFEIVIIPPWWQQWWFKILMLVLVSTIIGGLWRLRLHELKQKLHNLTLNQKLLRLQMNPHFIFNSLSSIQAYIYSNEQHLAGQYLSDFARLIRLILENSRHELITLDREIESIRLYMTLQQLRFENSFDFYVNLDLAIDAESYYIPPMLTQPFLENALEHGIKTIQGRGKIELCYKLTTNYIKVKIVDNGIGLTASGKQNQPKGLQHESLSLKICRERLALIERRSGIKIKFEIKEIVQQGRVRGTQVEFDIPLKLIKSDKDE